MNAIITSVSSILSSFYTTLIAIEFYFVFKRLYTIEKGIEELKASRFILDRYKEKFKGE